MGRLLTEATAYAMCLGGIFPKEKIRFLISHNNAANAFISSFIVTAK